MKVRCCNDVLYLRFSSFSSFFLFSVFLFSCLFLCSFCFTSDSFFFAVNDYVTAMKTSIKSQTEFQPKLMDLPNISRMKTYDIFIELLMQYGRQSLQEEINAQDRNGRLSRYGKVTGTPVHLCREIFIGEPNSEENPKSILVCGKAGIGKSLFCQKLIRDWAYDKLFQANETEEVPDLKFVYLLTFRQLNLLGDEPINLKELLGRSSILDEQASLDDTLFEFIVSHPEEVLIIIDGFDECSKKNVVTSLSHERYSNSADEKMPAAALCAKLMRGHLLRESVLMITSRPNESDQLKGIHFDRNVEITGFSEQQVLDYIEKYFQENESMKSVVLEHISRNRDLVSFAHIPVLCALMCCYMEYILTESNDTCNLPVSKSDLYHAVVTTYQQKHDKERKVSTLDKLSEIAAQFLLEKKFLFVDEDLETLSSQEIEALKTSGLLHCGPSFRVSFSQTIKYFSFAHLTLQEYLAACWFVKRREIPLKGSVSAEVVQFMAGILSKDKDSNFMEKLLQEVPFSSESQACLIRTKCLAEYGDKEFARNSITNFSHLYPLHFEGINDVDCLAVSFLLDIMSASIEEVSTTTKRTKAWKHRYRCMYRSLHITSSTLQPQGVNRIWESLKNDSCPVRKLHLSDFRLVHKDSSAECMTEAFSKLTELFICDKDFGDVAVFRLFSALKSRNCNLSTLSIRHNHMSNIRFAILCRVLQDPRCKVTTLSLCDCFINDALLETLSEALSAPTCGITTLNLGNNVITDAGVERLSQALQEPSCKVTSVDLSTNRITSNGVARLSEALRAPSCKVTVVNLRGNLFVDAGTAKLCEAFVEPTCNVTTVNLRGNRITDAGAFSLSQALQSPVCKVTFLDLTGNQITDTGVEAICQAFQAPSCKITFVNLTGNRITDAGVASLSHALQRPSCKLTILNLRGNRITDVGVASLSRALSAESCKLTELDLTGIQVTDVGVASLCRALQVVSSKLTQVNLTGNRITDAGVIGLCQALQAPNNKVTALDLTGIPITDEGILGLCQALQSQSCKLRTVNLTGKGITDAGFASLCQALQVPSCQVTTLNLQGNQSHERSMTISKITHARKLQNESSQAAAFLRSERPWSFNIQSCNESELNPSREL